MKTDGEISKIARGKRALLRAIFLVWSLIGLQSCYDDIEENLYGSLDCDSTNISYSNSVAPILVTHCYICHSTNNAPGSGSGIELEDHSQLITWVDNGILLKSITHSNGASPMPKNSSKLSDCEIAIIKTWINNGAPND